MAPRTRTIALAALLFAASVSAQVPQACSDLEALVEKCVPLSQNGDPTDNAYIQCLCGGNNFENDVESCLQASGQLTQSLEAELTQFKQLCASYLSGNPGSSPSQSSSPGGSSITSAPSSSSTSTSGSGSEDNSPACVSIAEEIQACWTDESVNPTEAPVANCICGGGSNFDTNVVSCVSFLKGSNVTEASTVAAFEGYCSSYATAGGSSPTSSGGSSGSSTTGVVIVGASSTAGSKTTGGSSPSSTGGSSSSSTPKTGDASSFHTTFLTSAAAAVFVVFALVL